MTHAPRSPRLRFRDAEDVVAAVRASGGRFTAARRAVLDALFAADGPVRAEEVAGGLGGRSAPIELASVYRALEYLEGLGAVRHFHAGHGPGRYALTGGGEREYLACERCGGVLAVEAARLDAVREAIEGEFGYRARFSHFPIVGLCQGCAASATAT